MEKIKALMLAGASLAQAVGIALGKRTLIDVAADRGCNRQNLTSSLNGARIPTPGEIDAMVIELGGTFEEWRELFADAASKRIRSLELEAATA